MRKAVIALSFVFACAAFGQAQVVVTEVRPPAAVDASMRTTWVISVENTGDAPATAVPLRFSPFGDFFTSPSYPQHPEGCAVSDRGDLRCTLDFAPREKRELVFVVQHSWPYGRYGTAIELGRALTVHHRTFARDFVVTHTNDEGPGSLRQAIADMNRDCALREPCQLAFRVDGPVPAEGWFTFRPLSPLPDITVGDAIVAGATQSRHTGETNPHGGPEIMIDGSAAGFAHGLSFRSHHAEVSDLAIGNFGANGIDSHGSSIELRRNYLGLDPTGLAAAPNGWRGVQTYRGSVDIEGNVFSGNRRAGAWITFTSPSRFVRNRVGVGSDGVTPVGNGASGVYFEKSQLPTFGFMTAEENVIGHNAHAGISLSLTAVGSFGGNTFRANHGLAIDINIDGPTLEARRGVPGRGGVVGVPRVLSARYEDGVTIVQVRNAPEPFGNDLPVTVHFYASAEAGDGGELLGSAGGRAGDVVELRVARDLRGQYVSASTLALYRHWDEPHHGNSEVSDPVLVQ